jgi:hypothetical protein
MKTIIAKCDLASLALNSVVRQVMNLTKNRVFFLNDQIGAEVFLIWPLEKMIDVRGGVRLSPPIKRRVTR